MSKRQRSNSTSSIDPQQRAMMTDLWGRATAATSKPSTPYGAPTVAGFTGDQSAGFGLVRQGVGQNVGGGTLNSAIDGTQQAMSFKPLQVGTSFNPMMVNGQYNPLQVGTGRVIDSVSDYMNPYLDEVAGGVMSDLDRARQQTLLQNSDAAKAAGAYGGSRHGVVDAETNRGFFDTAGQALTGIYAGGYDSALGAAAGDLGRGLQAQTSNQGAGLQAAQLGLTGQMANQDATARAQALALQGQTANQQAGLAGANLGLSAAGQLGNLSQTQRGNYFDNADRMMQIGGMQQIQDQSLLDDSYNRWLEEQNYDKNNVAFLGNVMGTMPNAGGTSSTSAAPSTASQIGSALGSVGMLMALSDKNVKSGRKKFDTSKALDAVEKTPVETWKYDPAKGGPADGQTHVGPMAQAVKKNLGLGSGKAFPVVDMIGTQMAATQALAKKVKRLEKRGKK